MYIATVIFSEQRKEKYTRAELTDAAEGYLSLLLKNGQLYQEYILGWVNEQLTAYVYLSGPDAKEEKFHSEWGKESLKALVENFNTQPQWQILEHSLPTEFVSWQSAKELVLRTNMFTHTSPVCRVMDGAPIPLYLLPVPDETKEEIYFWQKSYHCHDALWIDSADLETAAYEQLAEVGSGLSKRGRELCAILERATRIPTYYYLHRYYRSKDGGRERRCPSCGGHWQVQDSLPAGDNYWNFAFKCEQCRLVSQPPSSLEEEGPDADR